MSETTIFMLGCATSRAPSLDMGCVSLFWTTDGVGHRAALTFPIEDHSALGLIRCARCGFEPDEQEQAGIKRILMEYLDLANLADKGPCAADTSACRIRVISEEN